MSWNISRRLNNLQEQVNNIANEGLTNPLEQILNANNYSLTNLSILDGATNVLQLQTNNIGGITTNAKLTVSGDVTCNTLHYTTLDPPISPDGTTYTLLGTGVTQPTGGDFIMANSPNQNGFITNQTAIIPSASMSLSFSSADSQSSVSIGITTSNLYPPAGGESYSCYDYGLFWYAGIQSIQLITNGQLVGNLISYTSTVMNLTFKTVGNTFKILINGVENPLLNQPITPSLNYFLGLICYVASGITLSANNVTYNIGNSLNLADILETGNDAGNQSITGVTDLTASGTIECNTLKYSTLDPPVGGGGVGTLEQVLTTGNNAGGLGMTNVGAIEATSVYSSGYLEIGNAIGGTSQLHMFYGNGTGGGNNFQITAGADYLTFQEYINNTLFNTPIDINSEVSTTLQTNNLLTTLNGQTQNSFIIDSVNNTPCYKQVYNSITGASTNLSSQGNIFNVPIYTKTTTYNYGVNYGEILFSNLNLTFSCSGTIPNNTNATIYLSNSASTEYDQLKGNGLIVPLTNGSGVQTLTFNSTVPIILYYNNTSQLQTIYLNVYFNQIQIPAKYSLTLNSNFVVSGYIASNIGGSITFKG